MLGVLNRRHFSFKKRKQPLPKFCREKVCVQTGGIKIPCTGQTETTGEEKVMKQIKGDATFVMHQQVFIAVKPDGFEFQLMNWAGRNRANQAKGILTRPGSRRTQ